MYLLCASIQLMPWGGATQSSVIQMSYFHTSLSTERGCWMCIFGRPFLKRFALCCRSVVFLSCLFVCLSVCDVGVLWPNVWMDQDETWRAGRPRPQPHCVGWGPSFGLPQKGQSPQFLAHVYCGQLVACLSYCWALVLTSQLISFHCSFWMLALLDLLCVVFVVFKLICSPCIKLFGFQAARMLMNI